MVKENTASKSEEQELKEAKRSITTRIHILERECDQKRSKRVKRTVRWNLAVVAFLIVLGVLTGWASGNWLDNLIPSFIGAMWLGLVTILEIENHNKQWIIDMQYGLRELEREEIDTLMDSLSKAPSVTVVKQPRKAKKETK